jgi:chromosome segregation ATPase
MSDGFIDLRQNHVQLVEESFWPSFTDIMTVVVMIFLIATSILIVKNWELVSELKSRIVVEQKISQRLKASMAAQQKTSHELLLSQDKRQEINRQLQLSMEAERRTSEVIQKTSKEKATLEETLVHTQSELSLMRLQLMQARESAAERDRLIVEQDRQLSQMTDEQKRLNRTINSKVSELSRAKQHLAQANSTMSSLQGKLEISTISLSRRERELEEQLVALTSREQELDNLNQLNQSYQDNISNYERQISAVQQSHSVLVGEYEDLEDKYNKLIKPSRSAIGKYVVEVRYEKIGGKGLIQFRQSDKGLYQNMTEASLDEKLSKLKARYKDTLYVKIIIPDNSGLSYSEAWAFMIGILDKYDYYYQDKE